VLVDEDLEQVLQADREVGRIISLMRQGRLKYVAGGGGMYGHPTMGGEKDRFYRGGQKTLGQY